MAVKFVNRTKELAYLGSQKASLGKQNKVVLICGESGVGKSELTKRFLDQNTSVLSVKISIRQKESDGYESGYYFTKLARELHNAAKSSKQIKSLSSFLREGTSSAFPRKKLWESIKADFKKFPFAETAGTITDIALQEGDFDLSNFFQSTESEVLFALNDYVKDVLDSSPAIINIENFQGIDSKSLELLIPVIKYSDNCLYLLEFTENDKEGYSFFELTDLLEKESIVFSTLPVKPLTLNELKKIIEDEPIMSWELLQHSYVNWDGSVRSLVDLLARLKHGLLPLPDSFVDLANATREHLLSLSKSQLFVLSIINAHGDSTQRSLLAKLITNRETRTYLLDLQLLLSDLMGRSLITTSGDEISIAHDNISHQLIDIEAYKIFALIAHRFWLTTYEELLKTDDLYASKGWTLMKVLHFATLLNYDTRIYELLNEINAEALKSRDPEKMIFYVLNVKINLINNGQEQYKNRLMQINYWLVELYYKIGKSQSAWNILTEIDDKSKTYNVLKAVLLEQTGSHHEAIQFCIDALRTKDISPSYELALRLVMLVTNYDIGNVEKTRNEFYALYENKKFDGLFEYGFLLRNAELVFPVHESLPYYEKSIVHFERYGAIRQLAFSRITYGVHLGLLGKIEDAKTAFANAQMELGNVISERHTLLNNFAVLLLFQRNIEENTENLLRQAMLTAVSDFERITINIGYLVLMDWRDDRKEAELTIERILAILKQPSFASKEIIRYAYFDIYKYYSRINEETKAALYKDKIYSLKLPETPIWKFWLHGTTMPIDDEEYFLSTTDRAFSFLCNWNMEYDSALMFYG